MLGLAVWGAIVLAQDPAAPGPRPWPTEEGHVALGPFRYSSLSPFSLLRPGFVPRLPASLREGDFEAHVAESWANMWAFNEDDWILDYEVLTSTVALSYRATPTLLVELEVDQAARFGGRLDGLILDFHRATNAEQRHRDDFPKNDIRFEIAPSHGQPGLRLSGDDRRSFTETALFSVQLEGGTALDGPFAVSASLTVRGDLRGPDGLRGGSPADVSLSAGAARRLGPFRVYAGANLAWYGHEEFHGVAMRTTQGAGLAALEWKPRSRFSFVLQYLLTEGALHNPKGFRRPSSEIVAGFKWRAWRSWLFELAGTENFIIPDNSPDFGFHAGVAVRW